MRTAVTISLVPEARGGPFVFWDDLAAGCRKAANLGFDAVEVFPRSPAETPWDELRRLLDAHGLKLAAVGTGAGWVVQKLRLTDPDPAVRARAKEFVRSVIHAGGPFGAPAIIGSMQGRWGEGIDRDTALVHLADALNELGDAAAEYNVPLLYEPLNRYETNLVNTTEDGVLLLNRLSTPNVKLLSDLFHMGIEEVNVAAALRAGAGYVGHVHLADSNRRAAGGGHTDFAPIAAALRDIEYGGYLSAEVFPHPDPDAAAAATIRAVHSYFRGK